MGQSHRVFVYGTLMRGEHHHDLLRGARFEREAQTAPLYTLVWLEYYPALLLGGSQAVRGEVYLVDDTQLHALDVLEEHPDVYVRSRDTLHDGSGAQLYVLRPEHAEGAEPIPSGDFRSLPEHKRRP